MKYNFYYLACYSVNNGVCNCWKGTKCHSPGKHPVENNGVFSARPDFIVPKSYNIGIRTGINGLFVIDVDGVNDLRRLEEGFGRLPQTLTCKTGVGKHLYYRSHEAIRNRSKILGLKIDIRGINGYVITDGSTHINGHKYHWENKEQDIVTLTDKNILGIIL